MPRFVALLRGVTPTNARNADLQRAFEHAGFTAYVPSARVPVFMQLIERAFGAEVTTRTWQTVRRCAAARGPGGPRGDGPAA